MKKIFLYFLILISLCSLVIVSSSCIYSPYKYGIVTLKISETQEVYFKREARGVSADSLVLSVNKDTCSEPNSKTDYIFHATGPHTVYYKIENGILIIFPSSLATPPESGQFPIKVVQHDLLSPDFADLQKNYEERGLKLLEVKFDEEIKCR